MLSGHLSSNRTFMELKFSNGSAVYKRVCSNRTFMELKSLTDKVMAVNRMF